MPLLTQTTSNRLPETINKAQTEAGKKFLQNSVFNKLAGSVVIKATSAPVSVREQPPSHLSLFSDTKSFKEAVQQAVATSIKQQSNKTRDKASVVVHGLPENKQDSRDVAAARLYVPVCR
jgi:protoheme ferro-lyase